MVLRIGELKGLKWSAIDGDFIRIQRFIDDKNRVINSIKGNTADGIRSMPLTPATKAILSQVRKLQPPEQILISMRLHSSPEQMENARPIRNLFSIVATALWQPLPSIGI